MLLTYKNEITILYSGEFRNTYFEIKRSGGNDEQKKQNKEKRELSDTCNDSSRLFIPWGSNVLPKSINQRLLWVAHGWMYPCASVSKRVFVGNLSYKNEFDYHTMNL